MTGGIPAIFFRGPRPALAAGVDGPRAEPAGDIVWSVTSFPEIEAMIAPIQRVLSANATSFPGRIGAVFGFNAGRYYPQVFARDTGTFAEFASYLFSPEYLRTPVEEFLLTQESFAEDESFRGAVAATLSAGLEVDKATASSDEETSVIHAAHAYFEGGGGVEWLQSPLGDKPVLQRLNDAMGYLLRVRRDPATGLIFRAHTADWGDVKLEGGPRPTDLLPGDAVTASIFDQAFAYQALGQLERMNAAAGDPDPAVRFSALAEEIRVASNRLLWDEARGRYRIHIHLTPLTHSFDEDSIVSLGNAVAAQSGLASEGQARSIFDRLRQAAAAAGTRRAGLSVWPPYPAGAFNHPNMQPNVYQNGGVWDWWAGVQILAEFERGATVMAFEHLVETARHWRRSGQVPEWFHLPTASDQGSPEFTGAAGTFGLAVVRGLFGIRVGADAFAVTSRLGPLTGRAAVQHRPTGARISFSQRAGTDWMTLDITAEGARKGTVSVLLPGSWPDAMVLVDDAPAGKGVVNVMRDRLSRPVPVTEGFHTVTALRMDPGLPTGAWRSSYGGFFPAGGDTGFWITNGSGIGLWDGYQALGGLDLLGPVISGRFILDGLVAQAVQRAVLQWDPSASRAFIAPIWTLLSEAGSDQWIAINHRIPPPGNPDLGLLDRDPALKEYFQREAGWAERFGMPVSVADYPDVFVLRAQRAALQRWKIHTPWGARPGDITPVNGGAIARDAGLVPAAALAPVPGLPPEG